MSLGMRLAGIARILGDVARAGEEGRRTLKSMLLPLDFRCPGKGAWARHVLSAPPPSSPPSPTLARNTVLRFGGLLDDARSKEANRCHPVIIDAAHAHNSRRGKTGNRSVDLE